MIECDIIMNINVQMCFSVYQVVTVRVVHEKLLPLLSGGKQKVLTSDHVYKPFSGLNPLHYNPYTEVSPDTITVNVYAATGSLLIFFLLDATFLRSLFQL